MIDIFAGPNVITGKGKRIVRKAFTTKREAEEEEQKINIYILNDEPDFNYIRIDPLYELMKKEDNRNQRKVSYIQTQEYNYNRYIKSYFENSIVVQLTYEHIDEFRESLLKKELTNNSINVNSKLMEDLRKWKDQQMLLLEEQMLVKDWDKIQVFQRGSKLLTKDHVRKKYEAVLRRDPSIEKIRIHDFRHSHVAFLINNNEYPYMIKERIGHASITTIYDL